MRRQFEGGRIDFEGGVYTQGPAYHHPCVDYREAQN